MEFKPITGGNSGQTGATTTTVATSKKPAIPFDIRRYLAIVIAHWYWVLLSVFVALVIGFIFLQITKPVYQINSSLVVSEEENSSSEILDKLNIVKKTPVNFFNEMNMVHSEDLVAQTVDTLGLNVSYYVKGKLRDKDLYRECPIKLVFDSGGFKGDHAEVKVKYTSDGHFDFKENEKTVDIMYDSWIQKPWGRFKILYAYDPSSPSKYLMNEIIVKIKSTESTVRTIMNDFRVTSADGRTSVMNLTYNDNIPDRGIDFLNTLIRIYFRNKLKNIDMSAQRTRDFIDKHKSDLMGDLNTVDSSVEEIKASNDMVDVGGQANNFMTAKNEVDRNLDEMLAKRRALLNLRYLLLNSRYQIVVALDIRDNILEGLIQEYNRLVQKLETQEKVQELGASNPFLVQTVVELEALKRRILDVLNRISSSLESNIEVAKRTQQENIAKIKNVPGVDRKINEVKRGYDVLQNMYLFLFQKGIENEISVYNESNKSKILIAPYATSYPTSPNSKNIYMVALLIGLLIPLAILLIRQLLIRRIVNETDIKQITDIPIIGVISKVDPERLRNNYIAISPNVRTGISEQFRMLRTNLEFLKFTEDKKVISITSSDSGEGKTFVCLNLGLILALGTKRVVIVEFDLRKPRLADFMRIKDTNGVSEYLAGKAELKDVIKPSGVNSNLYIANCGQAPPNPGDLLAYPSTTRLIDELQEMFDVVIIDTPPLGLVSDALILSKLAGLNLYVVRQMVTTKAQLKEYHEVYKEGKIHNPAIIFNGVGYLKQYGYYYNPNKVYEQKLQEYAPKGATKAHARSSASSGRGYGYGHSQSSGSSRGYGPGYGTNRPAGYGPGYRSSSSSSGKKKSSGWLKFFKK